MNDFLTITQAKEYKGFSDGYLRKLCIDGKLAGAQKLGSIWIIPKTSLDNYLPTPRGRRYRDKILVQKFIETSETSKECKAS